MNITGLHIRATIRAASEQPRVERGLLRVLRTHFGEEGVVERAARLQRYAQAQQAMPFSWGGVDCCLPLADWAMMNGHPDGAVALRGSYSTEDECRAVIAAAGGVLPLVASCAERAGLRETAEPTFGCVAVIGSARRIDRQWGAIWNGQRWLVRWTDTFTAFAARPLAMWSV